MTLEMEDLELHYHLFLVFYFTDIHISILINGQLLEATARAVHPVLQFGGSGLALADGLSNLLKVKKLSYWNL